jgi:hypothetical protein
MQYLQSGTQEHNRQYQTVRVSKNMLWGWRFKAFKTSGHRGYLIKKSPVGKVLMFWSAVWWGNIKPSITEISTSICICGKWNLVVTLCWWNNEPSHIVVMHLPFIWHAFVLEGLIFCYCVYSCNTVQMAGLYNIQTFYYVAVISVPSFCRL